LPLDYAIQAGYAAVVESLFKQYDQ